ncbi:MAG: DNA translocase FtsK [Actinomycetes bacterium]
MAATKTSRARKPARKPARKSTARRSTARRSGSRKPAARRTGRPRSAPRRTTPSRARVAWTEQLGGHAADALAIGLAAVAVLTGLALATDLAGPFGSACQSVITLLAGRGAFLVPAVCVAVAVHLLRQRHAHAADGSAEERPVHLLRIGVGLALLVAGLLGLLALGDPVVDTSAEALRANGGLLGAFVATPLHAVLGTVGAAVVLVALVALGALVATGTSLARVIALVTAGWRAFAGHANRFLELDGGDEEPEVEPDPEPAPKPARTRRATVETMEPVTPEVVEPEPEPEPAPIEAHEQSGADADEPEVVVPDLVEDEEAEPAIAVSAPAHTDWVLPSVDLLRRSQHKEMDTRAIEASGGVLEQTLKDFGVDAQLVGMTVGPTVTRYELELAAGVKVNKVTGLSHDIAYAMASPDVRILAPIPGRSAIGVEVPNKQRQLITLGDILTSEEAARATHPLEVGLGRDIAGKSMMLNLATMPHLLIAGATGAGKSSCINSIITSILVRATPDEVRLILVDPKRVELGQYNGLPHLLTEVVANPKKAANALEWCVREMDMRYDLLAEVGVRDITGYNAKFDRGELPTAENPDPYGGRNYERLPFILIVVDELNDLMMVAARDVENSICRIAQMARAVGIHLIIATQRPSVDVITGVIKANVPSRLAFSVSSIADSRVILDQAGAEKLIGHGDMLASPASGKPSRVQGSWVEEDCVRTVVAHWKRQVTELRYVEGVQGSDEATGGGGGFDDDEDDDLLVQAMELVVRSGLGSTSMLQRKLRVGFARAGRLMDLLERKGVVGPSEGSKARAVLMTVEEFEESQGRT